MNINVLTGAADRAHSHARSTPLTHSLARALAHSRARTFTPIAGADALRVVRARARAFEPRARVARARFTIVYIFPKTMLEDA